MLTELMTRSIRKADLVLFGEQARVVLVNTACVSYKFIAGTYILDLHCQHVDPDVISALRHLGAHTGNFYLVFGQKLKQQISDATFGRPHIKAPILIWSMCTKIIWEKVVRTKLCASPYMQVRNIRLTPEQVVDCLPRGYEFPISFDGFSHLESVEALYKQEDDGYRTELGPGLKQTNINSNRVWTIDRYVEASVLSHIAVRCNNETQMLQFLKACSDRVMALE